MQETAILASFVSLATRRCHCTLACVLSACVAPDVPGRKKGQEDDAALRERSVVEGELKWLLVSCYS